MMLFLAGFTSAVLPGVFADYIPEKGMAFFVITCNIGRLTVGSLVPLGLNTFLKASGTFGIMSILQLLIFLIFNKVY